MKPKKPTAANLAEALREYMERTGHTQLETCEVLGIAQKTLWNYLNERESPKPAMLDGLLARLNRAESGTKQFTASQKASIERLRSQGWANKPSLAVMQKDDDYCLVTSKGNIIQL